MSVSTFTSNAGMQAAIPINISLQNLNTSGPLTAFREADAFNNTRLQYDDITIGGNICTGNGGVANSVFLIYAIDTINGNDSKAYPFGANGTDGNLTISSNSALPGAKLIAQITLPSTIGLTLPIGEYSLKAAFGFTPRQPNIMCGHNNGNTMNFTGNTLWWKPIGPAMGTITG